MAQVLNFEMRRGDTPTVVGYLRDEHDDPVDDPAAQYLLAGRATPGAADPALFEVGPVSQTAPGEGRCAIPTGATSGMTHDQVVFYDLQVTEGNGNVTTLVMGRITVRMDVAR